MTMALKMKYVKQWLNGGNLKGKHLPDVAPENRLTDAELHREIEEKCKGLLWSIAQKWHRNFGEFDMEDLRQEAVLGFYDARRSFDKSRGFQFNTYARYFASRRIQRFLARETKRGIHVPGFINDFFGGLKVKKLPPVCKQTESESPGDFRRFWERAKVLLVGRQYEVLSLRYREGLPMRAVSAKIGLSVARVGQIEQDARERILRTPELVRILEDAT